MMRVGPFLIILLLLSAGSALEVSPGNPKPGDTITIKGNASPREDVSLSSSFEMSLPVISGRYEYETSVIIPQEPNRVELKVRNVQDFYAGIKLGIWITKSFEVRGGTVRISKKDLPPGRYSLKMFGAALPGSSEVPVSIEAETHVRADSGGKFVLDLDTKGVPAGQYKIEARGETKIVQIGTAKSPSSFKTTSKEDETDTIQISTQRKNMEITPQVVRWYGNLTGNKIENSTQFDETEDLLRRRLKGGYWRIISRGDPLTEEAGECMQEFCLVRGNGACTSCRDKDILLKKDSSRNGSSKLDDNLQPETENRSLTNSSKEGKSLWRWVMEWFSRWLGSVEAVSHT